MPIRRWEWISIAITLLAFVAIRIPLFTTGGLILGWNSDAALFGLMARAMASGADYPLFFWGQPYLGTLTSMLTAVISVAVPAATIGPLDLRIAASLEVVASILFFWLGLRRTFGPGAAAVAAFWLAAGPAFLFHFTIAPIGAEQLLLIASLLFWYATHASLEKTQQWFALGLICGFGMWLHQGIIFMIGAVGLTIVMERRLSIRGVLAAAFGAAVGYLPAAVALLRNDPVLYRREISPWAFMRLIDRIVEFGRSDLWLLIAQPTVTGILVSLSILGFAVAGFRLAPWNRGQRVAALTIAFSLAFWIISSYPYPGAVRYIVPALPLIYGAAAAGIVAMWSRSAPRKLVAVIALFLITSTLYLPRVLQARAVAAGKAEQYTNWPGGFDPRPMLQQIRGYQVCYGQVWVAHKLEWISAPPVRFVPVDSVHRTLVQSLGLIEHPGPKCFVDNYGQVRALSPAEERAWKASVLLRARKAGI